MKIKNETKKNSMKIYSTKNAANSNRKTYTFQGSQYWILSFFFPQISQRKTSTRVQFIVRFTLNKKKH